MRAEILTIGDELCRGEIVDTNSSYLAARLWDLDITTAWMTSCNDDPGDIAAAVRLAAGRADVVVCSGGLGPTEDDLTVDVLAGVLGVDPVVDEPARAAMVARFERHPAYIGGSEATRGALAAIQMRQVRVPAGARVFANPVGLAPGFEVVVGGVPVMCLPGVPKEIYGIVDGTAGAGGGGPGDGGAEGPGAARVGMAARWESLRGQGDGNRAAERVARQLYRCFGRGESQISQACRGLVDGVPGASIHYQVKFPETLVKLVVRDRDAGAAAARLATLDAGLRQRLAGVLYGTGEANLVEIVTRRLIAGGYTVATAESCTAGMVGELLTRLPGSSAAYLGGAIVYSNAEKVRQLGVAQATLDQHGAVSEATVREMAVGAYQRFGGRLAVAISGVAGPGGGTAEKPVGTTWLAVAADTMVMTKLLAWPGNREQNRTLAAWWAIKLLADAMDALEVKA